MKKVLFLLGVAFLINGCGKEDKKELKFDQDGNVVSSNENWKTDPDEFKWMKNRCYAVFKDKEFDSRVPVPEDCIKFKTFYEKKTGKSLL